MSDSVVKVENLGKKFVLGTHRSASGDGLRHVLQNSVSRLFGRLTRRVHVPDVPAADEFWALNDVSFEIKKGDVVGFIGRNGAGKSTLLRILSRITEPTAGRIEIEGRVASLLEVGTGFHPELSGRENIYLNGAILGMSRREIRSKFDEIVAFAEVEKFLDTPVKHYSSGMYVRLAFSVAAHLEPEILIVDEVLAVGDAEFQKKCMGRMKGIAGEGRTILFVSHNLHAVQALCNKALYLKKGRVADFGPALDVSRRYLSETSSAKRGIVHVADTQLALHGTDVRYEEISDEQAEITIELQWLSHASLDGLIVDVAVENEDEVRILQFMPGNYRPPLVLEKPCAVEMRYQGLLPYLRPGHYTLTVYARLLSGVVLSHASGIPAFAVTGSARRPEALLGGFSGVMVPRFSLDVECHQEVPVELSLTP
jgi:lipopolysaccharide transport system ATP-binding protein